MSLANDDIAPPSSTVTVDAAGNVTATPSPNLHALTPTVDISGSPGTGITTYVTIEGGKVINVAGASGATFGARGLVFSGTYEINVQPSATPFLVFNFNPIVHVTAAIRALRNSRIFNVGGTYTIPAAVAAPADGGPFIGYDFSINLADAGVGGTATLTTVRARNFAPTVANGWTITNLIVDSISSPAGTGAIGTLVVYDIADFGARVTTPIAWRSPGALVQFRHGGPMVIGASAPPTNASCALEVQSTTGAFLLPRMTTAQRNLLTAVDGMVIYNTTTAVKETRQAGAWVAT